MGRTLPNERNGGFSILDESAFIIPETHMLVLMKWLDNILADGEHATKLKGDRPYFAKRALTLRPKAGPLEPFAFNAAQKKLHEIAEPQKAKTGRVRLLVS